jgi:putative glycosyltransferase (TIGR04372 family)
MRNRIIFVISFLVTIILFFFSIFIKIRLGRLYSSRVGHLCLNLDNYIFINKNFLQITLFATDKFISNKKILEIINRNNKLIFFSRFFFFIYKIIEKSFLKNYFLIDYKKELHPNFSLKSRSVSLIKFNSLELQEGEKFLKSQGLYKKDYVIFHNRDNAYNIFIENDKNIHNYRNFNFTDYQKTINFCNKKNILALRSGVVSEKTKKDFKSKFYSFTNSDYSEFNNLYLMHNSKLVVGGNSGFLEIASLLRKPILMINTIPFNFADFYTKSFGSIILPKKIYSFRKKRFLKIFEINNLNNDIHCKGDFYKDNGLKYIDNTPNEILTSFKEMLEKINDKENYLKRYKFIKNKLDKVFSNNKIYNLLLRELDINISYTFLGNNKFLL